MSVAHVAERAGVSRRTFYELFSDVEDCFLAAFEQALVYATDRVAPAYEAEHGWREKVRAGLVALLSFLDEEPAMGRVLVVEFATDGPATFARRSEITGLLIGILDRGRSERKAVATVPPMTGEGVLGAALSLIHARLSVAERERLIELANPLMSMIVLPYLGSAAARKELERPTSEPADGRDRAKLAADPFKQAGLRLSYRTVRVLMALAEHPRASNRLVADTAEIKDQGQTSKLLARLERAGMIANTGVALAKGAPNSWDLTENGRRVVSTIGAHTPARSPAPGTRR